MRLRILLITALGFLTCLAISASATAQADAAKIFQTNCTLCHGADGSGNTGPGKAFHAQDLRSDEVQKQTEAALTEVIAKGRGKMPAFGAKVKAEDIQKLVAYIRSLAAKK